VLVRALALGLVIVFFIAGLAWLISIPLLSGGHPQPGTGPSQQPTVLPTTGSGVMTTVIPVTTESVEQMPRDSEVYVTVEPKNPANSQVTVSFGGGPGRALVKEVEVRLSHPDGTVVSGTMRADELFPQVTLQGTKGTDRIGVFVKMYSGKVYKIIDAPVQQRIRP
jgi:hypothetical protein